MTSIRTGYGVPLAVAIVLLALGTALTHLFMGLRLTSFGGWELGIIFILNGLGYIGLTALLYLPVRVLDPYRHVIRYALMGYAALTILLWIPFGTKSGLGFLNKYNEIILIVMLLFEHRSARR